MSVISDPPCPLPYFSEPDLIMFGVFFLIILVVVLVD